MDPTVGAAGDQPSSATPPAVALPPPASTSTGAAGSATNPDDGPADARDATVGPEACAGLPVLVLGDGWAPSVSAARMLLEASGFRVTTIEDYRFPDLADGGDGGGGSLAVSAFRAVLLLMGVDYPQVPSELERDLVAAHEAGTGIVFEEWFGYKVAIGQLPHLRSLALYRFEDWEEKYPLTVSVSARGHSIWEGLPPTFTTTMPMGTGVGSQDGGDSTVLATMMVGDSGVRDVPAVLVRDGKGRVAQTALATNWKRENALADDPNVSALYRNMVKWVAHCR